jgi:hypothetical protein
MVKALLILVFLASIMICHMIAKKRGRNPIFWGIMGGLFGPLAIPFIYFVKTRPIDSN